MANCDNCNWNTRFIWNHKDLEEWLCAQCLLEKMSNLLFKEMKKIKCIDTIGDDKHEMPESTMQK